MFWALKIKQSKLKKNYFPAHGVSVSIAEPTPPHAKHTAVMCYKNGLDGVRTKCHWTKCHHLDKPISFIKQRPPRIKQAVGGRPPRYASAPLLPPWAPKRLAPPSRWQRSSSFPRPTRSHAHRCSCLMCKRRDE